MKKTIEVFPDTEQLIRATVEFIIDCAQQAISERGKFHVALSGGSTPREFYALLAQKQYAEQINWSNVHVYFGDERVVPQNHPDSNYLMARKTLLNHVSIPTINTHPIPIHLDNPHKGAEEYEQLLKRLLPSDRYKRPVFDLILLGIGNDGHTASLFPDTGILSTLGHSVAAVHVPKLDSWRISLTFPTLNAARKLLLVASGKDKADIIAAVHSSSTPSGTYPVQKIMPTGAMHWFLDAAAGSKLKRHNQG